MLYNLPGKVILFFVLQGFLYKQRRVSRDICATKTTISSKFIVHCDAMTNDW